MQTDHRWNTKEYEQRTKELYRVELHKLYPSEAWALYRTLPKCKNVIDLGCGNGAMAAIANQISPSTQYTGMDHQANLMNEAKGLFPFANFEAADMNEYLGRNLVNEFDCVMSWSVIKSFANWRDVVGRMVKMATKYVICDIRVANSDFEAFDADICWAEYGGRRGPITYLNFDHYKQGLLETVKGVSRIEFAAYQSGWGKFVNIREDLNQETFLVSTVLTIADDDFNGEVEVYEQLPGNLKRS